MRINGDSRAEKFEKSRFQQRCAESEAPKYGALGRKRKI